MPAVQNDNHDHSPSPQRPLHAGLERPRPAKAATLPADALILDLEDAVAPEAKDLAREQVCAAVKAKRFGKREVIIRVNGLDTPWGHDDIG